VGQKTPGPRVGLGGKSVRTLQKKKYPNTSETNAVSTASMVMHIAHHPTESGPDA
jgi:hypothetical protein